MMQTCGNSDGADQKPDFIHLKCVINVCNINRAGNRVKDTHCHCKRRLCIEQRKHHMKAIKAMGVKAKLFSKLVNLTNYFINS